MQYIHTIEIGDSERIALRDAIEVYKQFVYDKIGDEIKAPYWAKLQSIKSIENKIAGQIRNCIKAETQPIKDI
ncbi:MAG: hypothetical protein WAZ19_02500 [Anaerolineae bacterium]